MSQKFNVTKAEAAQFFDVSLKTIDAWLRKGMPYVQKGGRGKPWTINLREASKWRDRMADHSSHQWAGKPGIGPVGYEDRSDFQNGLRLITEEGIKNFLFDWFQSDNRAAFSGLLREKEIPKEVTVEITQTLFFLLASGLANWICDDEYNKSLQRAGTSYDDLYQLMTGLVVKTHPPTDPDAVKFQIPEWVRLKPEEFVKEYWSG